MSVVLPCSVSSHPEELGVVQSGVVRTEDHGANDPVYGVMIWFGCLNIRIRILGQDLCKRKDVLLRNAIS